MARVVETRFRQGTVVCPDYPAAVNAYMPTALLVAEAVLQAMASLVPDKTIAEGSGSGAIALGGRARDGKRSYVQYKIFASDVSGRNGKDGASTASFHLSNGKIAPVEIIGSEFPTQVEFFEILRDSGGRGASSANTASSPGRHPFLHAHRQARRRPPGRDTFRWKGLGGTTEWWPVTTAAKSRWIRTRLGICVLPSLNRNHRTLTGIEGGTVKTENELLKRITARPDVFSGKPIIRDMRISVEFILSLLAQGVSHEEILEDYPGLELEDIRACNAYAHAVIAGETLAPVSVKSR